MPLPRRFLLSSASRDANEKTLCLVVIYPLGHWQVSLVPDRISSLRRFVSCAHVLLYGMNELATFNLQGSPCSRLRFKKMEGGVCHRKNYHVLFGVGTSAMHECPPRS